MSAHHKDGAECPLCVLKLKDAHPRLSEWYLRVKARYQNVHISWSWRGEADQNDFYLQGRTRCRWPNSPHNHMEGGSPCSLALDLFQIDEDGVARFSPSFYLKLNQENEAAGEPLLWGGRFKSFNDSNHWQLKIDGGSPVPIKVSAA